MKWLAVLCVVLCACFLFYLVIASGRIHVKDEFYIEYLEMWDSESLWNGHQGFVGDVSEAYWNNDSLVVVGNRGPYLIIFGETKYNHDMIQLSQKEYETLRIKLAENKFINNK